MEHDGAARPVQAEVAAVGGNIAMVRGWSRRRPRGKGPVDGRTDLDYISALHVDTISMAARTVALDEEAYDLLKRTKRPGESFSDAVKRLARPNRSLLEFAGAWSDMTADERRRLAKIYESVGEADRRRAERIWKMWE